MRRALPALLLLGACVALGACGKKKVSSQDTESARAEAALVAAQQARASGPLVRTTPPPAPTPAPSVAAPPASPLAAPASAPAAIPAVATSSAPVSPPPPRPTPPPPQLAQASSPPPPFRPAPDTTALLGRDYTIGPGDLLEIGIFEWELREQVKTGFFRVTETGRISLPVMGDIQVAGKSIGEVKALIEDRLRMGGFLLQPRVSVDIAEYRSKQVAVVGAVNAPGVFSLRQNSSNVLEALALAGGLDERAGAVAYIIHNDSASSQALSAGARENLPLAPSSSVETVDLYALLERGQLNLNRMLRHGDVVNVPEAATFSVIGHLREPGRFPLKRPTTVLEAVAMASGFDYANASPEAALLKRNQGGQQSVIAIDLNAMAEGRTPDIYIQPDDVIQVPKTSGKAFSQGVAEVFKRIINFGIFIGR